MTLAQLAHVCALLGLVNHFVLRAAKSHLAPHPALQEQIVGALLKLLLVGDCTHLALTFWVLGERAYDIRNWGTTLWIVVVTGVSLFIPRLCWCVGLGRYVHTRDGRTLKHPAVVQTIEKL